MASCFIVRYPLYKFSEDLDNRIESFVCNHGPIRTGSGAGFGWRDIEFDGIASSDLELLLKETIDHEINVVVIKTEH